jgi:hypothetical protein
MRTTIFRSNRMAIAVVGALMAPTFAFGQHLTVTAVTAPSTPIQAQTTAAAPTIRPWRVLRRALRRARRRARERGVHRWHWRGTGHSAYPRPNDRCSPRACVRGRASRHVLGCGDALPGRPSGAASGGRRADHDPDRCRRRRASGAGTGHRSARHGAIRANDDRRSARHDGRNTREPAAANRG